MVRQERTATDVTPSHTRVQELQLRASVSPVCQLQLIVRPRHVLLHSSQREWTDHFLSGKPATDHLATENDRSIFAVERDRCTSPNVVTLHPENNPKGNRVAGNAADMRPDRVIDAQLFV